MPPVIHSLLDPGRRGSSDVVRVLCEGPCGGSSASAPALTPPITQRVVELLNSSALAPLRLLSMRPWEPLLWREAVVLEQKLFLCSVLPQAPAQPPALPPCTQGASARPPATALVQHAAGALASLNVARPAHDLMSAQVTVLTHHIR